MSSSMSGSAVLKPSGYFIRCHKLTGEAGNSITDIGLAASGTTGGAAIAAGGTTYSYSVRAYDGAGNESAGSAAVSVTESSAICAATSSSVIAAP